MQPNGSCKLLLTNLSANPLVIPANAFLGKAETQDPRQISAIHLDADSQPKTVKPTGLNPSRHKLSHLRTATSFTNAPPEIQSLILENHDIFSINKHDIGHTQTMKHSIALKDQEPVYRKQFRIPESHRAVLLEHLDNWLRLKIVCPSTSKYNSPIFCVAKKCGALRPVLDYRALNEKTYIDKYSS